MASAGESGRTARLLKIVGGVTAVLTLVFALQRVYESVSGRVARERRVTEQLRVARAQVAAGDHAAAWASVRGAAEAGGDDAEVRRAQEEVAMAWIRAARITQRDEGGAIGAGSFSELVEPLVPALDRGALAATGARKGDLLAHRGWADFLRGRDGRPSNPVPFYRDALAADSANPFAHAMWGHWLLWGNGSRDEALRHFAAAAASGRERAFVRSLQLAALRNSRSAESDLELLRLANAMRLDGDTLGAGDRRHVHGIYWLRMSDRQRRGALLAALPPDAHLATYRWLFDADLRDSTREASYRLYHAVLQAHAGDTAGARASFRALAASGASWRVGERAILDSALGRRR